MNASCLAAISAASCPDAESEAAWVHFCLTAAAEAAAAVIEHPPLLDGTEPIEVRMLRETEEWACVPIPDRLPPPEALTGPDLRAAAHAAASEAYRHCLPCITSKRRVRAYIACTAVGLQRGYVLPGEAKAMLYTAQLALAAYPTRRAPRGRK